MMRCEDCLAYIPAEKLANGRLRTARYGICKSTGRCHEARDNACKKNFTPKQQQSKQTFTCTCERCGAEFESDVYNKKYCSDECRRIARKEQQYRSAHRAKVPRILALPQCEKIARAHGLSYGQAEAAGLFKGGRYEQI